MECSLDSDWMDGLCCSLLGCVSDAIRSVSDVHVRILVACSKKYEVVLDDNLIVLLT